MAQNAIPMLCARKGIKLDARKKYMQNFSFYISAKNKVREKFSL